MSDVLAMLTTPFHAILDFALDAPGSATALALGAAVAAVVVLLAA